MGRTRSIIAKPEAVVGLDVGKFSHWAYGIGAVNGTSATTFTPNALLNREQCATMLTRVFKRITLAGWTLENDSRFRLDYKMPAKFADDGDISDYARELLNGVFEHIDQIDNCISTYSVKRSIRRLSKVVLAALRLAIYEILYVDDLDPTISINEAVELTKKFSGKDESGYVNGVLGGFLKAYNAGEIKTSEKNGESEGEAQ